MNRESSEFALLKRAMDQHLQPLGFFRKGVTWNRRANVVEVIDLQRSKSRDMITLNAGVLDSEVFALVWGKEPQDFVLTPATTVSVRIGQLVDGYDKWWPITSQEAFLEVVGLLDSKVLPFLAQMRSREAMAEWLKRKGGYIPGYPPAMMSLAIIERSLGHKDEAIRLLSLLNNKKSSAWESRIDELSVYIAW